MPGIIDSAALGSIIVAIIAAIPIVYSYRNARKRDESEILEKAAAAWESLVDPLRQEVAALRERQDRHRQRIDALEAENRAQRQRIEMLEHLNTTLIRGVDLLIAQLRRHKIEPDWIPPEE